MSYDPSKPADNSDLVSAELRSQLLALHQDIQQRALDSSLSGAIQSAALNPSSVSTFSEQGIGFSDSENQQLASKIDELISALRR